MPRIALILFLFTCTIPVAAQQLIASNQQVFKTEDGLPQSLVTGVVQDRDGFIWIGTQGGLARYDGRSFKTFSKKQIAGVGFRSHVITNLAYNSNNHIAIQYQGGHVDDLDPISFTITPITGGKRNLPLIKQLLVKSDKTDNLFNLALRAKNGKGVYWTDPETGKEVVVNKTNGLIHNDTIAAMARDLEGNIVLLTPSGAEVSGDKGKSFTYTSFRIPYDSSINMFKETATMPDNTIIMRYKNTLARININTRTVSYIPSQFMNDPERIMASMPQLDQQGRLYFQQRGNIYRLENTGELICLWERPVNSPLNITACFIDRDDVLWVSLNAQGLYKVNLRANSFRSFTYEKGFFPDVLKLAGIPATSLPPNWFPKQYHYEFYSAYGADSLLYVCYGLPDSNQQVSNIQYRKGEQLIPLAFPKQKRTALRGICVSSGNEIWVGDILNGGLWYWKNKEAQPVFFPFNAATAAAIRTIADIKCTGQKIWVSTHGAGLWVFQKNDIEHGIRIQRGDKRIPDNLTDIYIKPNNPSQLWIGSRGEGLILLDEKKGITKIFTEEDGLPNNTIYCIVADQSGVLWLSTNRGICRFNPTNFSSSYYVKADGLAGNEFNRYHKFSFPDGRIAMGGLDGFSVFTPSSFSDRQEPMSVPVGITGIDINNIPQNFNTPSSLIKEPFNQLKTLRLPYNKNYLSVEFAALQFNEPGKIQYRYMLKGADDSWHESGNNNIATYTQLRPGRYKLMMNATGSNGVWSTEIKELDVIIRPPFWANWWAYSFYILAGIFLINLYIRYHKKRLKEQQQLAFKQKEAAQLKELDAIKDRFFSNITHEFRTPLTLILTPLEKLQQDQSLSPQVGNSLNIMSRNAKQLLRLVNEFLDFSRMDKGQMKVNLSHGDFDEFVRGIIQQFNPVAEEKQIRLNYTTTGMQGIYLFDEEKWEKIFFNLINNALKFTDAGGSVNVTAAIIDKDHVEISVSDTGIGISPLHLPKIFERFYQGDDSDTRHYEGTGIGLALVKELVELMNGSIEAESEPGRGSSFRIISPLQPAPAAVVKELSAEFVNNDHAEKNNGHPEKPLILLAEDNDQLRQFLAEGFPADWNIITAPDGLKAHELILSEMPDVVVSDVMMPGRDGLELCKMVKQDQRTGHIGFMLLTSRAAHDVKLKGLEIGADDYIVKPFHLDELQYRIANLLQLQQKQREFLQLQALPSHPGPALPKVSDEFIRHLYELLDAHLDDQQLNVDFLSRSLSLSRSSLNRKLKTLLDISANDLIRRYRLQRATAMLAAGNDITSTAYQTGFNTPSYFSQCFREQYGITPTEYIASVNGA